jgi:hypothetical protein
MFDDAGLAQTNIKTFASPLNEFFKRLPRLQFLKLEKSFVAVVGCGKSMSMVEPKHGLVFETIVVEL